MVKEQLDNLIQKKKKKKKKKNRQCVYLDKEKKNGIC